MAQVLIELNEAGVGELLHEVGQTVCAEYAQTAASACGDGYAADVYNAGSRTIASVAAVTWDAYQDNLKNNTILRNIGNGG